ncbi:JmjC domain-containing protein [Aphelenchoides bicaudatus]|nr:JmjC domain-containing protein [Aphelenchoides bicaudatus]
MNYSKRGLNVCLLLFCIWNVSASESVDELDETNGGWKLVGEVAVKDNGRCNIDRVNGQTLTQEMFINEYAYTKPVIIENINNDEFQRLTQKAQMLSKWETLPVTLNSANTHSYKRIETTFSDYLNTHLKMQSLKVMGNETFYLFGGLDSEVWKSLLNKYNKPIWSLPRHEAALSFGIAGSGTGAFAEVIFGSKRWFLTPHEEKPAFDPDKSTLDWYLNEYPKLTEDKLPLECLLKPNEIIFFPDKWYHATLNTQTSVFISTFLSPITSKLEL